MNTQTEENVNVQRATSLIKLASFLTQNAEALPELQPGISGHHVLEALIPHYYMPDAAQRMAEYARILKPCRKVVTDQSFSLVKDFGGGVTIRVWAPRENVCTRKQVGTKKQDKIWKEVDIPEDEQQEIPVYEWSCPSILSGSSNE